MTDRNMHHDQHLPCLYCHPQSYIRLVQHLILKCLPLGMSQDGCVKALADHASIQPVVTLTVWRELEKENRGFFQTYFQDISPWTCTHDCRLRESRFDCKKIWQ